jgi:hypothetical protein
MSHFTVMITGSDLPTQLAPFCERTEECPPHILEFEDVEAEELKAYETGARKSFYDASSSSWGQVISQRLFESLRNKDIGEKVVLEFDKKDMDGGHYWKCNEHYHVGRAQDTWKCPDEYVWVKVTEVLATDHPDPYVCFEGTIQVEIVAPPVDIPFKETYATFEEYMEDWSGHDERDNKTNRYGYWRNPQAKWDWFEVGGRWAGFFHIKPEFRHLYQNTKPNFSWGWKDDPKAMNEVLAQRRVDSALKGHVDWDFMMDDAVTRAGKEYDFAMSIIGEFPENETWEVVRTDCEDKIKAGEKDIDSRAIYWAQPRCKAWQEYGKVKENYEKMSEMGISSFSGSPDDYLCSREVFVDRKRRQAICPFALLHNGKWAEKGKMGWWAMVSDENDNWTDVFHKVLATLPDDTQLTMVDCHI